uniref:mucin-17 isoform X2 n=1 Tax=Erigeron canadensis TaxID=72917 RepID=UPI001CB9A5CC|nr:mucin-17 isoform X2 [Erigeron canadensis]
MDIDDNDAQDQNLHLTGEGSSKVSPILHPYALPKFEFDDSLHGHLRFDSLVDNEVFLGITSQEDNQWIEEYSRETSSIQFSSSVVESTHKNVWSEATSLESVEMLLKSVGQEEKVVEDTSIEELDVCDRCDSVNNIMDSTLQENLVEPKVSSGCEQSHALESRYEEIKISIGELDSVVSGEQKTDKICDDVHQEAIKLASESSVNELQEDPSFSKVECANAGSSWNLDASAKKSQEDLPIPETSSENARHLKNFECSKPDHIIKNKENNIDNSINCDTVVEIGTFSMEKFSAASNVECVDKQPVEGSTICKEPTVSLPLESCSMQIDEDCNAHIGSAEQSECSNSAVSDSQICSKVDHEIIDNMHGVPLGVFSNSTCVETQAIEDADMKSEVSEFSNCNVGSPSNLAHLHSHSVEETENDVGGNDKSELGESIAILSNSGCVATEATEDVDMKLEVSDFPKFEVDSLSNPSHLHSLAVEEIESGVGSYGKSEMGEALAVSLNSGCVATQATQDIDTKLEVFDFPNYTPVVETENGVGSDGKSERGEALATPPSSGCVATQATEDVDTKSNISDFHKSNVGSVSSSSHLHSHTVKETENGAGSAGISEVGEALAASPKNGSVTTQATEDVNTKSEISDYEKFNVGSVSNPSHLHSHTVEETDNGAESAGIFKTGEALAVSPNSGCVTKQTIKDADTKPEVFDFPKDSVGSLSSMIHLRSSVKEAENDVGIDGKSEIGEGSEIDDIGKTLLTSDSLAEMPAQDISNKPEISGNNAVKAHTAEIIVDSQIIQDDDATQLSESIAITKGQATNFSQRQDEESVLDFRDMDMNVVGTPDRQKVVEPSLSFEGYEGDIAMGQGSKSITTVLTDAANTVESSKISSPDTTDGAQLPSGTVSAVNVSEGQSRSPPIPGLSLLHGRNEARCSQIGITVVDIKVDCDAAAAVESSKISSPDTTDGAHLPSTTVSAADVREDQSKSLTITGLSLLHSGNKAGSSQIGTTVDIKVDCDAAAAVESSKISSPDTTDGAQLPSGTVSAADVSKDQSISPPVPGLSLLQSGNEVGSSQIGTTIVDKKVDCDAAANVESSKNSSPGITDGAQLLYETVSAADSEYQSRSPPIPGPSLLHSGNELGIFQIGTTVVDIKLDCELDCPIPAVEMDDTSDGAEKVVDELAVHCDPFVGNLNASPSEQTVEDNLGGPRCSKNLETIALPFNLTAKGDHNAEADRLVVPQESSTGEDGVEPLNLAVNTSSEQQTSVELAAPPEIAINHEVHNRDGAAVSDNPEDFSVLQTKNVELSESVGVVQEATKGNMYENSPLSTVSKDDGGLQPVSSVSETKEVTFFTFDVIASDGQNLSLLKNTKVSSASSYGSQLDPIKLPEGILAGSQLPGVAASEAGAKLVSKRKPRRQSAGRESAKKGNELKQTTSIRRSQKGEKTPALINLPASGHVTPPAKDLKSSESIECSNPKPGAGQPISTPNLPDLNSSTHLLQQSFTDNQQLQLRAQIFVYGSLISGVPPEEPHMIAAFGQSDGGRTLWEGAWHACLERIHRQKSKANNLGTPTQSRSVSGNRDSEEGIKVGSVQSKVISSPIVGPMIPVSSPLWNVSTPYDGSQSKAMPRSHFLDYRPALSPLHPCQSPHVQSIVGHNPSWPSQGPLSGQWVSSSPVTPFGARLSALPITESVKLTTVKESGVPGNPIPVDPSAGSTVSSGPSSVANVKKAMVSSGQPSSDLKSRKRKKVSTSQAEIAPLSAPVTHLSWAPRTEGYNQISFVAQTQANSGTPLATNHSSTLASLSTPLPIISKSNHGELSRGDQNMEKIVTTKDIESKIEESKVQAVDAAVHATAAVSHCQSLWSQLETQKSSGLVSDDEAKLASSAVSIAAASSVAKVAAAAAKIASNVAEQAKLMAEEVFRSSRTESNIILHDKANTVISAAREAARRRIEAASAASKHAENLDAIVKAAELAAEAVSQAGTIVSMGNPLTIRELVEAGPEGYWKTQLSNQQGYIDKQRVKTAANGKEFQTFKHGVSLQEGPGDIAKKQMILIDGISGSSTSIENGKSVVSGHKGPDLSKMVEVISGSEFASGSTYDVDHNIPQGTSGTLKENIIREGCFVEVYKDDDKIKGAWFAANVLTLKDGKAFVCYTEIKSDDGSGTLKEWVPLEAEASEAPRIRIAHPMTTLRVERTRKRGRTAITDYAWCSGDRVDVWLQDRWCEAVVVETNRIDLTSLTVRFPAQEKMSVVRSWHVRPTLIWKDFKWIEWSSLKGGRSSEGETPHEKRQKFGDHILESKEKGKESSIVIDLVEAGRHQDASVLPSSVQGSSFDIGKSSKNENNLNTHRTMKSSIQKDRSRVVFGVPKPGKKQKFMDVSTHYVPNYSVKPASHMMSRGSKDDSKNDAKEKQVAEVKSKRKPPIPSVRPLAQKDKSKTSKHMSRDAILTDKVVKDSLRVDENLLGHQNQVDFVPSSDTEDGRATSTSKASQRLNKRKIAPGDRKENKVEVRDISTSELEPRRSNRRIQPTSRLLEGLQSSLSVSKIPSVSHASQRSHKVTSKGSTDPR